MSNNIIDSIKIKTPGSADITKDIGAKSANITFLDGETLDDKMVAFTGATSSTNGKIGLVPAPVSADRVNYLKGDGTWDNEFVSLTKAQYDALTPAQKKNGKYYYITDINSEDVKAIDVPYDGTLSKLTAFNVQDAIDEVFENISSAIAPIENGTTSSQSYNIDDYIFREGKLYRVIDPIAESDSFVVNVNIEETTIMAELIRLTSN